MRKHLSTIILSIILLICIAILSLLIVANIPRECKHYICDKIKHEPTCEEKGYTVYTCKSCDYSFEADFVAPLEHVFREEVVAASCEKEGFALRTCENCSFSMKYSYTQPTGHTYVSSTVEPTCDESGYTLDSCKDCDFEIRSNYTAPTGHTLVDKSVVAPTCDASGYSVKGCEDCDFEITCDFTKPTGHTLVNKSVVKPTCEKQGYSLKACSNCSFEIKCDYTKPTGHTLSSKKVAPTCEDQGYTIYSCGNCSYTMKSDYKAPSGHVYSKTYIRPTVESYGYTLVKCNVCKSEHETDYVFYSDIISGAGGEGVGGLAFGLDISKWAYDVDFEALKAAGVEFVIIRIGYDDVLDPNFVTYYNAAKAAGLDVGVYFFTYAEDAATAKADAQRVAAWLREFTTTLEYPVYFDIEDIEGEGLQTYLPSQFTKEQITEITLAFVEEMLAQGYYPGLYTNNHFINEVFTTDKALALFDVWYARYPGPTTDVDEFVNKNIVEFSSLYSMWQYQGDVEGYLNGVVEGACDFNYAFKDYPSIIKAQKLNGYK